MPADDPPNPDSTAWMLAVVVRLSELLNIPIEDAARIYLKIGNVLSEKKPS